MASTSACTPLIRGSVTLHKFPRPHPAEAERKAPFFANCGLRQGSKVAEVAVKEVRNGRQIRREKLKQGVKNVQKVFAPKEQIWTSEEKSLFSYLTVGQKKRTERETVSLFDSRFAPSSPKRTSEKAY